ncbi:MAG TPA: glycosyltransferase family 1 protein [Cytophagaceae bacterium]|jgi:glycosyltransferase involved in cell wall biosynthesis|nr:glycosyltransferase family 1 protein [Cytophagaceae bacterium]
MAKIAVNTRLLLEDKMEGIGWFTYETMKRMVIDHPEHEFLFIFDRPYSKKFIFADNVKAVVLFPPARHPFLYLIYFHWVLPFYLSFKKIDLFISPDGIMPLKLKVPVLNVIHDINFEHRPKDLPFLHRWFYTRYYKRYAEACDRLVTVSEYSKQDLVKTYGIDPDKIDVVYNGANEKFTPLEEELQKKVRHRYANGRPYFVYVGSINPRKNIANLLRAFDAFKKEAGSDMKLVLVGNKMQDNSEANTVYLQMIHKQDVLFLGRVSTSDLKDILASAYALTYVPYFEGFGIPILEAMYCDVPVITSDTTSMPEVAGHAALLVDPHSVKAITVAMVDLYSNHERRKELIKKGKLQRKKFSWDITADKLWQAVEKTLQQK